MYLTREEERMLSGEYGEYVRKAMEVVVKVGEMLGAERLVEVVHAHVSGVSIFNIGEPGLHLIEEMASAGTKFSVFTTVNPYAAVDAEFSGRRLGGDVIRKQMRVVNALTRMGGRAFTCAPYHIRIPKKGEHLAWAESNAVLYANSVAGAMTLREGGPMALMEAIVGRAPMAGPHLPENRVPDSLVALENVRDGASAAAAGYIMGKHFHSPDVVPYVVGLPRQEEHVRLFLAAFGASGSSPMAVIEGITPDYKELLARGDIQDKLVIGEGDIRQYVKEAVADADVGLIGCPHLSREEALKILEELGDGARRELWVFTGAHVGADVIEALRRKGVRVLVGQCPVVTRLSLLGIESVITDSGKALHYLPKLAGVRAHLISREHILRWARGE